MIDGKLQLKEKDHSVEITDPNKMWDRLIMKKMALRNSESLPDKVETKFAAIARKQMSSENTTPKTVSSKIELENPITVRAVNKRSF